MIRRFVRKAFPAPAASATAAARMLPTASAVPASDATPQQLLTLLSAVPAGRPLTTLAVVSIRYMLPGVGAGAGGDLERTMSFDILHDDEENVMMLHMHTTKSCLKLNYTSGVSVRQVVAAFMRDKPLHAAPETVDRPLTDLLECPYVVQFNMRAY